MRNVRIYFLQNEINNEIWAFLARITKRNLVLFKRNIGQGQEETRGSDMVAEGMMEVHTAHATDTTLMEAPETVE